MTSYSLLHTESIENESKLDNIGITDSGLLVESHTFLGAQYFNEIMRGNLSPIVNGLSRISGKPETDN